MSIQEQKRERAQRLIEFNKQVRDQERQARLARPADGVKPELVLVRVGDVWFDDEYQTNRGEVVGGRFDENRARVIAENWDWNALDPITVNVRPNDPDRFWCPDGRHRTEAARMRFGPDEFLLAVRHQVTREREVQMFYDQDKLRKRVLPAQKFTAKLAVGDPTALEQQAILDRLGIRVDIRAKHRTVALKPFLECCDKSLPATEEALRFLVERFDGADEALVATRIKGVTWFVANRRDHPNFRYGRVQQVFETLKIADFLPVDRRAHGIAAHQHIASMLVEHYNHKLTEKNRIPWWNDKGEA